MDLRQRALGLCLLATTAFGNDTNAAQPAGGDLRLPVTILDILAFREVTEQRMSPAGDEVALVTRVADLAQKHNQETLALVRVADGRLHELAVAGKISRLCWDETGRVLFALFEEHGRLSLRRFDATTATSTEVWQTGDKIDHLAVSPDGRHCLISRLVLSPLALAEARMDSGLVYEYGRHGFQTLVDRQFDEVEALEFLLIDTATRAERKVARVPYKGYRHMSYVVEINVAPDNRRAAVRFVQVGKTGAPAFHHTIAVLDLANGNWNEVMPDSKWGQMGAAWLGDSGRLFFVSNGAQKIYGSGTGKVYAVDTSTVTDLAWAQIPENWIVASRYDDANEAVYLQLRRALLRMSMRDQRVEKVADISSTPSFDAEFKSYAFISEASEQKPEVAVRELPAGAVRRLTNLNPYLDKHNLGRVEKLTITNAYGTVSTAYLVYPVDYQPGRQYPLILGSYGFSGRFILTAEWHTTFPAQTLAGQGYALLLVNTPSITGMDVDQDPRLAREREGWQVLSTFETAVQKLVSRGVADPGKLGLYGWSHGAFIVEFLLAHSRLPFRAACVGEGGDYNPSGYWLWGGKVGWPAIYHNTFGGPLTAKTAAAYLEFSPVLNVDRIHTPLLMEFVTRNGVLGLEILVPLKERGIPVELVLYEGEAHNFLRPTVRFASMHRKVDWFNFWMLGQEDIHPAKASQYASWRQMRAAWARPDK